jgi:DNA-binding CsgD family transcriptional regulator
MTPCRPPPRRPHPRPAGHAVTCGAVGICGRDALHCGHHGGWRSAERAGPGTDVRSYRKAEDTPGRALTLRQVQVLAEYVVHADATEAAACMGLALLTFRQHLRSVYARTGTQSTIGALWRLGWVTLPPGHEHPTADTGE